MKYHYCPLTEAIVCIFMTCLFFAGLWLLGGLVATAGIFGLGGLWLGIEWLGGHFPALQPAFDAILLTIAAGIHYWWLLLGLWIVGVNLHAFLIPEE